MLYTALLVLYNTRSYNGFQCVLLNRSPCPHCHVIPSNKALCQLFSWPGIHVPNHTDLYLTGKTGRSRLRGSFFQPQKTHYPTLLFICLLIYCNWVIQGFSSSFFFSSPGFDFCIHFIKIYERMLHDKQKKVSKPSK